MNAKTKRSLTVETIIEAPISKVWEFWTQPTHITQWNHASEDWHSPYAENDLRPGGRFLSRMAARDGSFGFDFTGTYGKVIHHQCIEYTLDDGRDVKVVFTPVESKTKVVETFEAEDINALDLQQMGWQSILNNFKKHVEEH